MGRWVAVCAARQLAPGRGRTVLAGGRRLALFNDGGTFRAIDDSCPHRGASLGEGLLLEGNVICPWHQWTFELASGVCVMAPEIAVRSYACRVEAETVEIEVPEETT